MIEILLLIKKERDKNSINVRKIVTKNSNRDFVKPFKNEHFIILMMNYLYILQRYTLLVNKKQ